MWFASIGLALVFRFIYFFSKNPTFLYFWDYLGHVQESINISWPWIGGWNNLYWGGYPTILYPPASHWLLGLLNYLTKTSQLAVSIFIILSIMLLLHSLWIFSKQLIKNSQQQLVAFALSVIFYLLSPVNSLVSMKGTLFSGTITATLAISIFIYFLSQKRWYYQGFLLGILFLTHALTSSMALLFMAIQFTYLVLSSSSQKLIEIKHWLYSLLLASLIGLPWILTFLDRNFQHTAFNITGRIFTLGIICLVFLIIGLITQLISRKKPSVYFVFTLLAGLLSILPLWPMKIIEQYLVRGIHFYRYYSFLVILAPIVFIANNNRITNLIFSKINPILAKSLAIFTIILTLFIPLTPYQYRFETYLNNIPNSIEGRFIDTADMTDIDLFTRAADHLVANQTPLMGSHGLFFESSSTGMNYAVAKHLLNQDSYSVPIYKIYIEKLAEKVGETDQLLDLLGINYQVFTTKNEIEEDAINFAMIDIRDEKNGVHKQSFYHLKKINDTQLVEPLSYAIDTNQELDLWKWWSQPDRKLTTRTDHQPPISLDLGSPQVNNIKVSQDKISFFVDSDKPAPIYIKFSYNPYWQARALSETAFTSQPLWVTPGNMAIYAMGDIELSWQTPSYLKKFGPISVTLLIITTITTIIQKTKSIKERKSN